MVESSTIIYPTNLIKYNCSIQKRKPKDAPEYFIAVVGHKHKQINIKQKFPTEQEALAFAKQANIDHGIVKNVATDQGDHYKVDV